MHRSTGSRLYPLKHDWLVALVEALQDKDCTSFISILSCPVLSWIHQNIQWMVVECITKWVSFLKFIIIRNSGNFGGPCKPPLYFPQNGFLHLPLNLGAFIFLERHTQKDKKDETTKFMWEISPGFTCWPLLSLSAAPVSVLKTNGSASRPGGKHLANASWPISPKPVHHAWGKAVTSLAFKVFLLGYPIHWQSVWAAQMSVPPGEDVGCLPCEFTSALTREAAGGGVCQVSPLIHSELLLRTVFFACHHPSPEPSLS